MMKTNYKKRMFILILGGFCLLSVMATGYKYLQFFIEDDALNYSNWIMISSLFAPLIFIFFMGLLLIMKGVQKLENE